LVVIFRISNVETIRNTLKFNTQKKNILLPTIVKCCREGAPFLY